MHYFVSSKVATVPLFLLTKISLLYMTPKKVSVGKGTHMEHCYLP